MRVDGQLIQPLMDLSRVWDHELNDLIVRSLISRMRHGLLTGHSLDLPSIGELTVRQKHPYALVNPTNGQTCALGGERTILFRPDRQLVRDLNAFSKESDVA